MTYDYNKSEVEKVIIEIENVQGFKYSDMQKRAIYSALDNNVLLIAGKAGSGKTSVVNGIFKVFERLYAHLHISQCALSAKAARRMYEVTGKSAYTIHKTLGLGEGEAKFNKDYPIESDILICDEASMNNVYINWSITQAIPSGGKLIFVFDFAQLPAIGAGAVAHDLLEHGNFAKFKFEEVYRQGQDSNILTDANKIRQMKKPFKKMEPRIDKGDIVYLFSKDRDAIHKKSIDLYMSALDKFGVDNVMMICPRRNTVLNSVEKFNKHIQPKYIGDSLSQIKNGVYTYNIGDVIIHRKNNADLDVMNGEVGKVIDIPNGATMVVDYGYNITELMEHGNEVKKIITYRGFENINQTELAYSYSVHSAQGSQAKAVIVVLDNTHYTLLDTTLLYTAITRAKNKCFVVAEPEAFKRCMTHHKTYLRNTNMKNLLTKGE